MTDSPSNTVTEDSPNTPKNALECSKPSKTAPSKIPRGYTFDNLTGWRRFRVLQPCRGMYHDIRRRLPYYASDITDTFTYRAVASTIRMYFVKYVAS